MKSKAILTFTITVFLTLSLLLPFPSFAQGDGGRKRKKKEQTEQIDSKTKRQREAEAKRKQQEEEAKLQREAEEKRKQEEERLKYNGHEYVDLGLPSQLKWAACNIGSPFSYEYGNYYAWGEVITKLDYSEKNIKMNRKKKIDDISGNPDYDAARHKWGGSWRIPTKTEWQELIDNCQWEWTYMRGKNGYRVTGTNGNSIFLPAAGYFDGTSLYNREVSGSYGSSTPFNTDSKKVYILYFDKWNHDMTLNNCIGGHTIRPVSD